MHNVAEAVVRGSVKGIFRVVGDEGCCRVMAEIGACGDIGSGWKIVGMGTMGADVAVGGGSGFIVGGV